MYPRLFELGPVTVYTYGVLLAAAYLLGLQLAMVARQGARPRRQPRARPRHLHHHQRARRREAAAAHHRLRRRSRANPRELLTLARSGGVFYGGLILAVVVALLVHPQASACRSGRPATCSRRASRSATSSAASAACSPAAATASRRRCRGAITFTDPFAAANVGTPLGVPLHPTQLYEAGAELLILVLLLATERKGRPFAGRTFWLYMLLYAVSRFIIEFYRGDERGIGRHVLDLAVHLARARAARHRHAGLPLARRRRPSRSAPARPRTAGVGSRVPSDMTVDLGPPTACRYEPTVPVDRDDRALDRFLVSVLALSRSQIQRLIKDGHVHVGGQDGARRTRPVQAGTGDRDRRARADRRRRRSPRRCRSTILYQDRDLIVVDKPAGMVVHPAAGHASGTLVNALLHHVDDLSGIGGEKRPGHRASARRGTSGLMVVAKNDAAHEELARQFHDREVEKEYIALVWGVVQAGRRIDAPIGRDPDDRKKMSARARPQRRTREAVTRIVRAEHFGRR